MKTAHECGTRDPMPAPAPQDSSGLLTVVLTDLVDSVRIISELGDHAAHVAQQRHDRLARDLLAAHGGREIDKSDGFLLLFEAPAPAVMFALRYHEALRQLSVETGVQWRARVGIQLGELYVHENAPDDVARGAKPLEVDGLAKPLAARLMNLAQGGQTLLGTVAFDLAQRGGVELPGQQLGWLAHGRYRIKGSEPAMEVFEVGVVGQAPLAPPPDSEKAHREVTEDERLTLGWRPGPGLEVPQRAPWKLARKLGAGGFGEVWLAEHPQTGGRRVFKFCHDAERLRSLKREVTVFRLLREALGDRGDIVRIIDWQLDAAPFFIEAEHVDGGDLMAWAEAHGGLERIPLAQRLDVVAQVADALAAAHSVGVLHKDIKPANILIREDADGQPRALLTDFGIGMVTDRRQLLAHGITVAGLTDFLDTPGTGGSQLYMAPETLQGKAATIQADIYALGVVLYELAAGHFKPLAPGWQRDIDDDLLAADIASLVDGDPGRRPASAARVARDLRELPARRAKLAAQQQAERDAESTRRALVRAQRRRRWTLGLSTALALVATVVGYSAWQASIARDEAELRRAQADRLIGFMLDDLREKLKQVGRLDVMDAVGAAAMQYFETIPADQLDDADLAARSKALYQIGDVRVSQGDLDGAERAMSESLELAKALAARAPDDQQRQFDLAQSHFWVGFVEFRRKRLDAAMTQFERYREIAEWLVAADPDKPEWQVELGYAHSNIGSVLEAKGDIAGATPNYERLLEVQAAAAARAPADPAALANLANAHNKLGRALESGFRLREALTNYEAELKIFSSLAALQPSDQQIAQRLATSRSYTGLLLHSMGRMSEGSQLRQLGLDAFGKLAEQDQSNLRWQRDLLAALIRNAAAELDAGNLAASRSLLGSAARIHPTIAANFPEFAAPLRLQQARMEFASANHRLASQLVDAALGVESDQPMASQTAIEFLLLSGQIAQQAGKEEEAKSTWRNALARVTQPDHASLRELELIARLHLLLDQRNNAEPFLQRVFEAGARHQPLLEACASRGIPVPPL
jgi:eukaryotic-like serine/threonine-protein kinase